MKYLESGDTEICWQNVEREGTYDNMKSIALEVYSTKKSSRDELCIKTWMSHNGHLFVDVEERNTIGRLTEQVIQVVGNVNGKP